MCKICHDPGSFLEYLMQRAESRRERDKERKALFHGSKPAERVQDPKRPFQEERFDSVLCYASGEQGRYAGYSGNPGGMKTPQSDDLDPDQYARRINRLKDGGLNERNRADMIGLPGLGGASTRNYCHCAEPAALSIAISRGETVGKLVFASFKADAMVTRKNPTVLFLPCPNCTSWLNRLSAGYFTEKDTPTAQSQNKYLGAADTQARSGASGFRERSISLSFAIDPGRMWTDTPFSIDSFNYIFRCFRV